MRLKYALLGSAALLFTAGAAHAQDPRDALISDLAARLEALEAQLADLKEASAADSADIRRIQSEAPQVTLANGRPQISVGSDRFAIRGLIQFDAADYNQDVSPTDLSSGTNFRRARLGIEGTVNRDWNYNLTGEFGGTAAESAGLNAAWLEYAGFNPFGTSAPLRIRAGAWATPINLEDATNNTEGLFLERPAASELSRAIAAGDGRTGIGLFANGDRWYGSAVLTGAVIGSPASPEFDEQVGYILRGAWLASKGPDHAVHIGANLTGVIEPADTGAGPASVKVARLRERPELRVDGTRFVDTGNLAADGVTQYGVELGGFFKNLYMAGEYFRFDVDRTGAPEASFDGWYAQAAWTLTGEKRQWNAGSGGFQGVRPSKTFNPREGTWGAWEIAARHSVLNLDHDPGLLGAPTPVGGVRGGEQTITTVGLNWYPNRTVRFLLDYQWVDIDRLNAAGAQIGEDFTILSTRAQVAF